MKEFTQQQIINLLDGKNEPALDKAVTENNLDRETAKLLHIESVRRSNKAFTVGRNYKTLTTAAAEWDEKYPDEETYQKTKPQDKPLDLSQLTLEQLSGLLNVDNNELFIAAMKELDNRSDEDIDAFIENIDSQRSQWIEKISNENANDIYSAISKQLSKFADLITMPLSFECEDVYQLTLLLLWQRFFHDLKDADGEQLSKSLYRIARKNARCHTKELTAEVLKQRALKENDPEEFKKIFPEPDPTGDYGETEHVCLQNEL